MEIMDNTHTDFDVSAEILDILVHMGWTDSEISEFFRFASAIEYGKYAFVRGSNPYKQLSLRRSQLPGRSQRVEPTEHTLPEMEPGVDHKEHSQGRLRIARRLQQRGWTNSEYAAARELLYIIHFSEPELLNRYAAKKRAARENILRDELNPSTVCESIR